MGTKKIISSHKKDTQILFYDIQSNTTTLLSSLLYQREHQKNILVQKHREVEEYFRGKDYLNMDLTNIYKQINKGFNGKNPYNIYVTNPELIIKNTTYEPDLGFNLGFAKKSFDTRHKMGIVECSSPFFKKKIKKFFSFSDSYFLKDGKKDGVLQLSYSYDNSTKLYLNILKSIEKYPQIKDVTAYVISDSGHISKVSILKSSSIQPTLQDMLQNFKDGASIENELKGSLFKEHDFIENGKNFKAIYLSSKSPFSDKSKILYSLVFDDSEFHQNLKELENFIYFTLFLGFGSIVLFFMLRKKEIKYSRLDKFIQSSMHEIKTPLSIITLNHELRELEFGKDEYSQEIDSAIKTLKTSYGDMSFTMNRADMRYKQEVLSLEDELRLRVDYFKTIASSNSKTITLNIDSTCRVKISLVELCRLIDNNISNAIKYSQRGSEISITLKDNLLSFHNKGEVIQNKTKIFKKYYRENSVVGGHGLGLSIVKDIASTHNITISLTSDEKDGTTFSYRFDSL